MKLTVDGEAFEFDAARMTNVEGMAIERVTGMLFVEWTKALEAGSMLAQTALVWVIKKRREPSLRFDDVTFEMASIEIEDDEESDPKGEPAG